MSKRAGMEKAPHPVQPDEAPSFLCYKLNAGQNSISAQPRNVIIVMTPTVKTSKPSAAAIDMPMGVKSVTIGSMPAKMMWMNSTSSSQTIRKPV